MPKQWFIPAMLVQQCERNQASTFIEPRKLENGEIALFNKNGLRYQYFNNCFKALNCYGWVGEAEALDPYFSNAIEEVS